MDDHSKRYDEIINMLNNDITINLWKYREISIDKLLLILDDKDRDRIDFITFHTDRKKISVRIRKNILGCKTIMFEEKYDEWAWLVLILKIIMYVRENKIWVNNNWVNFETLKK